jgi:tetratricopeptide (TPR) repeat protein
MPYRANLGDTAGALASYRKALAIAEDVRKRQPGDATALLLIADLHDRTGWVEQRALRFRDALSHHEAARAIRESLHDQLALARTWVAIADARYVGNIQPASVRNAYENAVRILDRLPSSAANRKDLLTETGRVHQRLGGYFTGAIEHDPARALQMRALPILRDLAAADADNVEAQHDLAFAYTQTARAEMQLKRWPEASNALDSALSIHTRLIQRDPTNREERRDIASLYGLMSSLYESRGDAENAEKFAAMAREKRALLK